MIRVIFVITYRAVTALYIPEKGKDKGAPELLPHLGLCLTKIPYGHVMHGALPHVATIGEIV